MRERRRSFKAKKRLSRTRGGHLGSSLERDLDGTEDLDLSDRSQRSRTPPRNRLSGTASSFGRPQMRRAYDVAFGTSQRRDANFVVEKQGPKPATKYGLGGSFKVHKPVKNQTIGAFLKTCNMLYQKGEYEQCKKKTEEALKDYDGDKDPVNGQLYVLCAKANFKLGYLIFAENLLHRCFKYQEQPDVVFDAHWLLG